MTKPRGWMVRQKDLFGMDLERVFSPESDAIYEHVIEYSSYDELNAEIEKFKAAHENLSTVDMRAMGTVLLENQALRNQRNRLQAEVEGLKSEAGSLYNMAESYRAKLAKLEGALRGILEIGKRDMSNPKYDGYFEEARATLEGK